MVLIGVPWVAATEVSRDHDLASILTCSTAMGAGGLFFVLVGAAVRRIRTLVCAEGIVQKNVWGRTTIIAWSEIERVDIGWFFGKGSDELPKGVPEAKLMLSRILKPPVKLPLGMFPSRRTVVQIMLAGLPEETIVNSHVHEYLDKLTRLARGRDSF